jgi:LemA protein
MMRGCLIATIAGVLILVGIGGCGVGKYNHIVANHEGLSAKWAEVDNQYKRRTELVPLLVATVQGAADFEKGLLTEVTEARASVGKMQISGNLPTDPAQLQAFLKAQQTLGASRGRLIAVAESYPDLKASENFLALQDQLEGTENRIATARRDYIESVRTYNTSIRKFPDNILASTFDFGAVPQMEFDEGIEALPAVEFDFDK